jgi:hypothetical protein
MWSKLKDIISLSHSLFLMLSWQVIMNVRPFAVEKHLYHLIDLLPIVVLFESDFSF